MNRVFVYGTLKLGQRNAHFLSESVFVGKHVTQKSYSMYSFGDYPAVCLQGCLEIRGEVYLLSDEQFSRLDELEGYPSY